MCIEVKKFRILCVLLLVLPAKFGCSGASEFSALSESGEGLDGDGGETSHQSKHSDLEKSEPDSALPTNYGTATAPSDVTGARLTYGNARVHCEIQVTMNMDYELVCQALALLSNGDLVSAQSVDQYSTVSWIQPTVTNGSAEISGCSSSELEQKCGITRQSDSVIVQAGYNIQNGSDNRDVTVLISQGDNSQAQPTSTPPNSVAQDPGAQPTSMPISPPMPSSTGGGTGGSGSGGGSGSVVFTDPTSTPTATPTATPTSTPVVTPTPTPVASPTPTPVPTATPAPTSTPVATATPTVDPTATPTTTPVPTATPTATPVPTATPAPTATATPSSDPEPPASCSPVTGTGTPLDEGIPYLSSCWYLAPAKSCQEECGGRGGVHSDTFNLSVGHCLDLADAFENEHFAHTGQYVNTDTVQTTTGTGLGCRITDSGHIMSKFLPNYGMPVYYEAAPVSVTAKDAMSWRICGCVQ